MICHDNHWYDFSAQEHESEMADDCCVFLPRSVNINTTTSLGFGQCFLMGIFPFLLSYSTRLRLRLPSWCGNAPYEALLGP